MRTQTQHEKQILKEIQGLPEPFQKKMAEINRFLKTEFFNGKADEKKATEEFLSVCGTWEDERSIKDVRSEIQLRLFKNSGKVRRGSNSKGQ